jgi:hypothetical protein
MSWNKIDPGNARKLTASFTDAELGGAVDPDAVFLTVMQPGETEDEATVYQYGVDGEIVKDDVGEYSAVISFPTSGQAFYRWWSTGDGQASQEQMIEVRARQTTGT